ncbi:hypothetical protein DVH05_026810 [Phytophthora capsici]|nr:hypothetical protein DVH05_026810 [Phytophthora capsici]|eukprot:jgi/Phyca11/15520/fgenesh1_pg.PHYCAscaffold_14_\
MSGKAARVKRKAIFWDRDGVNGGKSSLQVVLDWLSTETNYNKGSAIVQRGEKRPLAMDDEADLKRLKADPVEKLLAQQRKACKLRADKTSSMLQLHENELKLKQREVQLKEDRNEREMLKPILS